MQTTPQTERLTRDDFARLLEEERGLLRVVAAGEVGRADAEDVVQDAAIAAMRKLEDFTPGTSFGAWMITFVRFTAANHRRAAVRRTKRRLRLAERTEAEPSDPSHAQLDEQLLQAIDSLSPDQRVCLLLRAAMSHSYEHIGASLGMPAATVRSHVRRARLRLLELFPDGEVRLDG